ncbi:hypothetical protein KW792_00410 [Candidatus Saccharibacteria bacterium]|nr:hypothetical protein [Candidatus Saccharibacteria bacterium]
MSVSRILQFVGLLVSAIALSFTLAKAVPAETGSPVTASTSSNTPSATAVSADQGTTVPEPGLLDVDSPPPIICDDVDCTPVKYQCNDGRDNDSDGRIDYGSDPGCAGATDDDETDPPGPPPPPPPPPVSYACSDGGDNDGDGFTDYGSDVGCSSPQDNDEYNAPEVVPPACSDKKDNDADGKIDYGSDPGCTSMTDTDETDPPPPPPPPPPAGDTSAPTVPGSLRVTASTVNSIAVAWAASSDNVGVKSYGLYKNGSLYSSTTSTNYTFGALTCGTSYTLAVDAYDAAGNRSTKTSIPASTATCSTPSSNETDPCFDGAQPGGAVCTLQAVGGPSSFTETFCSGDFFSCYMGSTHCFWLDHTETIQGKLVTGTNVGYYDAFKPHVKAYVCLAWNRAVTKINGMVADNAFKRYPWVFDGLISAPTVGGLGSPKTVITFVMKYKQCVVWGAGCFDSRNVVVEATINAFSANHADPVTYRAWAD